MKHFVLQRELKNCCLLFCCALFFAATFFANVTAHAQDNSAQSAVQISAQLAQAKSAYDARNAVQAISLYTAFLDKNANDPRATEARYYLAESYLQINDYAGAGLQYKTILDTKPDSEFGTLALFRIGEIPYLLEKYDFAKPQLLSFIEKRPYDACNRFALYYLGDIAMQCNSVEEAAYYFGECAQLFPNGERFGDCKLGMAWVKEQQNAITEADAIYRELSLDTTKPQAEEALCRWGCAQAKRGETAAAIATLESFLTRYPTSSLRPFAQEKLATLASTSPIAPAISTTTISTTTTPITAETRPSSRSKLAPLAPQTTTPTSTARSVDFSDPRKVLQSARTQLKNRQYAQVEQLLTQLLAHDITGNIAAEALFLRADALLALKRTSEAMSLYEEILADYPSCRQYADSLWALGLIYERRGDSVAASDYFTRLVEDYQDFAHLDGALYYLAWNEIENGSSNRAVSHLQKIDRGYSQGTYWSHAVWTLAWLAYQAKNSDVANEYINKVLARAPDEAIYDRVLYLKGKLAIEAGTLNVASAAFQELRKSRPESPLRDAADQAAATVRASNERIR